MPDATVDISREAGASSKANSARFIAFYLPQYHPIAENDKWWGPGFTEWRNVAAARPLFRGHVQPNLPGHLGFYDLRLPEVREAQAQLAMRYGVTGFCYWHYWFAGQRLLDRPFNEVLETGTPTLPFCLAWANESWSGTWHGKPNDILIRQTYPGIEDFDAHFYSVLPALRDPRYIRVDGRAVFYVYRPFGLPDPSAFLARWRELAATEGLAGMYFVGETEDARAVHEHGFDATVKTPLTNLRARTFLVKARDFILRSARRGPAVYRYGDMVAANDFDRVLARTEIPCVMPNWDNTPRTGRRGVVLHQPTAQAFGAMCASAVGAIASRPEQERLVFVKSWNEWAEGNYLEPDIRNGLGFLRALGDVAIRHNALGDSGPE